MSVEKLELANDFDEKLKEIVEKYEAKIIELQAQVDEAIKLGEFYGDYDSWDEVETGSNGNYVQAIIYTDEEFIMGKGEKGGKHARKFLAKVKK